MPNPLKIQYIYTLSSLICELNKVLDTHLGPFILSANLKEKNSCL